MVISIYPNNDPETSSVHTLNMKVMISHTQYPIGFMKFCLDNDKRQLLSFPSNFLAVTFFTKSWIRQHKQFGN